MPLAAAFLAAGAALTVLPAVATPLRAQAVRTEFQQTDISSVGDDGFVTSSYGFNANFFGVSLDYGTVCANGYLILGGYAPSSDGCIYGGTTIASDGAGNFSGTSVGFLGQSYGQVLSPYFSDLNPATGNGAGRIWTGTGTIDGRAAWAVTWDGVGGFPRSGGGSGTDTFQLVLIDAGNGLLRTEFNYGRIGFTSLTDQRTGIGIYGDFNPNTGAAYYTNLTVASYGFPTGTIPAPGTRLTFNYDANGAPVSFAAAVLPEPSTVALTAVGLLGAGVAAARRRRSA